MAMFGLIFCFGYLHYKEGSPVDPEDYIATGLSIMALVYTHSWLAWRDSNPSGQTDPLIIILHPDLFFGALFFSLCASLSLISALQGAMLKMQVVILLASVYPLLNGLYFWVFSSVPGDTLFSTVAPPETSHQMDLNHSISNVTRNNQSLPPLVSPFHIHQPVKKAGSGVATLSLSSFLTLLTTFSTVLSIL